MRFHGRYFATGFISLIFLLLFNISADSVPDNTRYMAMVDLGSTGSRIYLYKLEATDSSKTPKVTEIKLKKSTINPGLSTLAFDESYIKTYFKPIIESLNQGLKDNNIPVGKIEFYAFATAGLRTVSPYQRDIMLKTIQSIAKENGIPIAYTALLEGYEEGIFDWITVNYDEDTLSDNQETYCVIDMGGGSTEIAFDANQIFPDVYKVKIGSKTYFVYSKSYLGLGMDFIRYQVSDMSYCWQTGFPMPTNDQPAHANFFKGVDDLSVLITLAYRSDAALMPDIPLGMKIIGLGGFYYITTDQALNLKQDYDINDLETSGVNLSKITWNELLKKYKQTPFTFEYLFAVEYITALLKNGYHFRDDQVIESRDKIKGLDSDWTLGAAIYIHQGNKKFYD